jgi:hypothetical protein
MDTTSLLAKVDAGISNQETTFRFAKGRALTYAVLYGLVGVAIVAFAIVIAPNVNRNAGGVLYGAMAVAGLIVLSVLWRSFSRFRDYRWGDTNLLVVTAEGVLRRLRGQVRAWPFSEFADLQVVTMNRHTGTKIYHVPLRPLGASGDAYPFAGGFESIYLNQEGGSFQQEIVDDGSFGPMQDIALAIIERARTWKHA